MSGQTSPQSEDLVTMLNTPGVSLPDTVHKHECRYWRNGKSHGPCTCGARELGARLRIVLAAVGVRIHESPREQHDRNSLHSSGTMCIQPIHHNGAEWFCMTCGWRGIGT